MTECSVWWSKPIIESENTLALLDPTERTRYDSYRRVEDRRRFLTGRVLAKTVAAEHLGVSPAEIHFDATCTGCGKQHGPVRVPDAELELSVSHSGERVGVAATSGAAVGLDVEAIGRNIEDSLIAYALNDTELATLPEEEDARAEGFFTYWTRKEAVMKATGRGLRIPLRSLTLAKATEPARLLASDDPTLSPESTRMADLDPGSGYRAAVAVITTDEIDVTERWWTPPSPGHGQ